MSEISHSDELVTKQDLSNFYQGILPYLGGMPEMLANKFSKGDLYSTDEKMIGQWINGKPLYQKTFTGNSPNADFSQLEFATVPSDAELFWITDAFLFASGSSCVSANGMAYSSEVTKTTVVFRCWISAVTKKIMMTVGAEAYRNKPCYVTVLYTKTTDSAVSIGTDTDYSTTEKIVGTWIDGKPIYQKTMKVATPSVPTQGTQVVSDVPHGIQNIEARVSCTLHGNGNCQMFGNSNAIHYMMAFFDNTNVHVRTDSQTWQNSYVNVTMRYTKTTD